MNPLQPVTKEMADKAILNLTVDCKSNVNELMKYRENVPVLIARINMLERGLHDAWSWVNAYEGEGKYRNNKAWTDFEDELLIDFICDGHLPIEVAAVMGRTESAIRSRLSHLVGVKRLSQQIAGKFIGTADGKGITANLVGTIYKE